ncbi:MAG TPA: MFS transporter [Conexibacter sp.]
MNGATAVSGAVVRDSARNRRNGFLGAYLGWMFDGYETFATVLVAASVVEDLVGVGSSRAHPLYIGGILAATLVAWAFGGLISGVLADRFGRSRVMLYSILWYALFAGLTAIAPSYALLLVFRFLTGLGMGAEWGAGSSLVSELADPRRRGFRIALLQSGFGVGFLIATGLWQVINNGNPGDWRWMYLIGVVPALLTVYLRRSVKDSEMWSDADKQRRAAEQRVADGEDATEVERTLARPTIRQLLDNPSYRKQAGVLLIGALATTLGWWAVSTWIPQFAGSKLVGRVSNIPDTVTLVVVSYNFAGVLGYLAMGVLADRFGRKPTIFAYFAASLAMTPVFFLLGKSEATLIILAFINGFFTLGQWTWLALYPSEVFPTQIRATAMTVVFNTARFAAAAGAMLAATLIDAFGSISTAAIVIGCVGYAAGMLIAPFIGPETRAKPLPGAGAEVRRTESPVGVGLTGA